MSPLSDISDRLHATLAELASAHGVPGASVAVLTDEGIAAYATGVLSTATGVEATTDTVFQIGSITKVWNATLVLQLVDEGLVELDAPVRRYVPELALADDDAASSITVRQLLSHQAGFEGDIFTDTGRGDDAVEKFVTLLADAAQLFPPGHLFSYSNAGYVLLGRLVERVLGTTWEQALLARIAQPLGLDTVSPSPYEAILHRAAVGHVSGAEGEPIPAPFWALARSNEPAGSMLAMSASDLALFAAAHLRAARDDTPHDDTPHDDAADDTPHLLSPASAAAMRETQVRLPPLAGMGAAWGLGWEIARETDGTLFGHDGNTVGQASFLRLAPDAGVAVVLLTNGGDGAGLFHALVDPLLRDLTGAGLPAQPAPVDTAPDTDVRPFLGVYANSTVEMEVSEDEEGRLWLEQRPTPELRALGAEPATDELERYSDDALIVRERKDGMHLVLAFLDPAADGTRSYLHVGRAIARIR